MKQESYDLALDVRQMKFDKTILIKSFKECVEDGAAPSVEALMSDTHFKDGYAVLSDDFYLVLYNSDFSYHRINWTLAHEIGHIYLGHKQDKCIEEIEAHWFAAELLAPEPVIRTLITRAKMDMTAAKLCELFNLSKEAGRKRCERIKKPFSNNYLYAELANKYRDIFESYAPKNTVVTTARQYIEKAVLQQLEDMSK